MLGSVNAAPAHFHAAVNDLTHAYTHWGDHIRQLITNRHDFTDFESALQHHDQDEIKTVVEWNKA
jgi:aspartate/glutamate racemase